MKRAIALFLAMLFVLALVPASALADGSNPKVSFTASFREKDSKGNFTALSGSASFTREYDATTGLLAGASTEKLALPASTRIIKNISVDVTPPAKPFTGTFTIDNAGLLTFTGGGITVTDYPSTVALVVTIEYRDPTLTFGSNVAGATYPGSSSALASGQSIPSGSVVTVSVNPPQPGGTFVGLSGVTAYTDVVNDTTNNVYSAKFTMPAKDVTVVALYTYSVTLKSANGTILDTKVVKPGDTVELAAGEPIDEVFALAAAGDVTVAPGGAGIVGLPVKVSDGNYTVPFTLDGGAAGATLTIADTATTKLYKLNMEDCELVSVTGGAYKTKGSAVYAAVGATVTLQSTKQANSYEWIADGAVTGGTDRTISYVMTAAEVSFSARAIEQYKVNQVPAGGGTPTTTYHIYGSTVTATADANHNGYAFVRWDIDPIPTEVSAKDLTKNPISFAMPANDVTLTPVYLSTLQLTNATFTYTLVNSEEPKPVKYKSEIVNGDTVDYWYVSPGTTIKLSPVVPKGSDGTYVYSGWRSNASRVISGNGTFTMSIEDIEVSTVWQTYTLTVKRFVNSARVETYTLRPGEYITLDAQVPSGGTKFNYWTHTAGLTMTVNDVVVSMDKPTTQRITVQMGSFDAFITANYISSNDLDYIYTGAYIQMMSEPVRYYALREYFRTGEMVVYYYPDRGSAGTAVDNSQLVCRVLKPGTNELGTNPDGSFSVVGEYELEISFYVAGKLMAEPIRVLNTPSTYIHAYSNRPEFVAAYTPHNVLTSPLYYEGEAVSSINKDGLVALLVSADHTTGIYASARELNTNEYSLVAYNPDITKTPEKIPTIAEIEAAATAGRKGYKVKTDSAGVKSYYMQLGIYCEDKEQLGSDGKPTVMTYVDTNPEDYIWIEVRASVTAHSLAAFLRSGVDATTAAADTEVKLTTPGVTYPNYSWEIDYSKLAMPRTFELHVNGARATAQNVSSVLITNEDSSVAAVANSTATPYLFTLTPKSVGVTTVKISIRGKENTTITLEITVRDDQGAVVDVTKLESLNKSSATLYVGNKLTLYPTVYSPNNADTAMEYSVQFVDALEPRNAAYYVSVDSTTGVIEALKYTDRPIRVIGRALNFAGTAATQTNGEYRWTTTKPDDLAFCDVTIAQIPVFSMTMYPVDVTLFRLASTKLTTRVYPEAATDQKLNWTSSNSAIVSVDNEGVITANMLGTATITATSNSDPSIYKSCVVTVKQSVLLTELSLNRTSATLGIGDSTTLTTYFAPATATTQTVTWTTTDASVATVDKNGKVHGISEGSAVIIATADDGSGKRAACAISVSTIVSSAVVLNKQTLALVEDESETLTATVYPTNVSTKGVTWTTSNPKVAVVDADGVVTGTGGGSAVITATSNDASARYTDCVVVVTAKIPVTGLALNLSSFDLLLNDTTTLTATVSPANATDKVVWTSSAPAVASVDEKGKVSGLTTGSAVITAKAGTKSIAITVSVVTKVYSTGTVVNCARRVNVRASASGASALTGYAYLGDTFKVLDRNGNWFKIQYNATTTAYIWSRYLNATETTAGYVSAGKVGAATPAPGTTATPTPVASKTISITNCQNSVNVRSGAGTSNSKLGLAYLDETFTYTGTSNDSTGGTWYVIEYKGGTGYVSSAFVKVN